MHGASEAGVSVRIWGRLWVLVTPKSAHNNATGFEGTAATVGMNR